MSQPTTTQPDHARHDDVDVDVDDGPSYVDDALDQVHGSGVAAAASTAAPTSAEPSVADDQQADANPDEPARRPEGSPYCWPFQKLPRRKRAEFMAALAPALDAEAEIEALVYPADHPDEKLRGEVVDGKQGTYLRTLMSLAADIEDAMVVVAQDEKVMRTWSRAASDRDLIALMRWYMRRFQVGEA